MATKIAKLSAAISPKVRDTSRAALSNEPLSYQLNLTSAHTSSSCSAALFPTSSHMFMHIVLPVVCVPITGTTFCLPRARICVTLWQERIERAINMVPAKDEMVSVSDFSVWR